MRRGQRRNEERALRRRLMGNRMEKGEEKRGRVIEGKFRNWMQTVRGARLEEMTSRRGGISGRGCDR